MKVVINRKYGGFDLSPRAIVELAKRKGIDLEVFITSIGETFQNYQKLEENEWDKKAQEMSLKVFVYVKASAELQPGRYSAGYNPFNDKDKRWSLKGFDKDSFRADPDLVTVVEELGDRANTWASDLDIVEIPDGAYFEIIDYDGVETLSRGSW